MNDKLSIWLDFGCSTHPRIKGLASDNYKKGRKTTINELMRAVENTWIAWYRSEREKEVNGGYVTVIEDGRIRKQHIVIAEKALGRPLRGTERVHHVDGNRQNNSISNLVICPDQAYHALLHKRDRMLTAMRGFGL